jgi:hypothetical protein
MCLPRRPVALLFLMLALFTALIPVCGIFSILFVSIFLYFVALVVAAVRRDADSFVLPLTPCASLLASRAPPLA